MDVLDDLRKAFIGQIVAKRAFCLPALENWGPDLHNLGPDGIVALNEKVLHLGARFVQYDRLEQFFFLRDAYVFDRAFDQGFFDVRIFGDRTGRLDPMPRSNWNRT